MGQRNVLSSGGGSKADQLARSRGILPPFVPWEGGGGGGEVG
jgi:hypothetical protein